MEMQTNVRARHSRVNCLLLVMPKASKNSKYISHDLSNLIIPLCGFGPLTILQERQTPLIYLLTGMCTGTKKMQYLRAWQKIKLFID